MHTNNTKEQTFTKDQMDTILEEASKEERWLQKEEILFFLETQNNHINQKLLEAASKLRYKYFSNKVQIHIINNIRNGTCPEDCGYCAQMEKWIKNKKGETKSIPVYAYKSEEEILEEARSAWEKGAYRYCLVSAGRGPNTSQLEFLLPIIRRLKQLYPRLELCLSAGLVHDIDHAHLLKEAGLDRYNHNLNTSSDHYAKICSTHSYEDRIQTLNTMQKAGVQLCSGLIAGMGESNEDLAQVLLELASKKIASIPINFFIPIKSHRVSNAQTLQPSKCLRILAIARLLNPRCEIRLAAGRELYLADHLKEALSCANSLFVSGYLNVRGSDAQETYAALENFGYEIDQKSSQGLTKQALKNQALKKQDLIKNSKESFIIEESLQESFPESFPENFPEKIV